MLITLFSLNSIPSFLSKGNSYLNPFIWTMAKLTTSKVYTGCVFVIFQKKTTLCWVFVILLKKQVNLSFLTKAKSTTFKTITGCFFVTIQVTVLSKPFHLDLCQVNKEQNNNRFIFVIFKTYYFDYW